MCVLTSASVSSSLNNEMTEMKLYHSELLQQEFELDYYSRV